MFCRVVSKFLYAKRKPDRDVKCSCHFNSEPLLQASTDIWSVPVYKMLRTLYDNYDADVTVKEDRKVTMKDK